MDNVFLFNWVVGAIIIVLTACSLALRGTRRRLTDGITAVVGFFAVLLVANNLFRGGFVPYVETMILAVLAICILTLAFSKGTPRSK